MAIHVLSFCDVPIEVFGWFNFFLVNLWSFFMYTGSIFFIGFACYRFSHLDSLSDYIFLCG